MTSRGLFAFIAMTLLVGVPAHAEGPNVPRCWQTDQPDQKIQDSLFRIFIPTENSNALKVALVLGTLSQSLTTQVAVGTSDSLDQIEIDVRGELKYWQPTSSFPTLESFKAAILSSLQPVLTLDGVTVECANSSRHDPAR